MKEIWKPVVGYERYYSVSSYGKIRNDKRRRGTKINKILQANSGRYPIVKLYGNKKHTYLRIHKIVAETFLGECYKGYEVNHKDGNGKNNFLFNLEYCTHAENVRHALIGGFWNLPDINGKKNGALKLNKEKVIKIRNFYSTGNIPLKDLSKKFNMSIDAIGRITRKETWKYI